MRGPVAALLGLAATLASLPARAQAPTDDPTRPPQRCGMTDADLDYGPLREGTVVTLQRHRFVRGDDNWDAAMLRFLGREARVTALSGIDAAGCPGIRVDVDGGTFFWRVRDVGLGTEPQPRPARSPSSMRIPQACSVTGAAIDYGDVVPGAIIAIGPFRDLPGDTPVPDGMIRYVGRRARVTSATGRDSLGCPSVMLDVDGGTYAWRIRDLRAPDGAVDPETVDSEGFATFVPSAGVTSDHGRPAMASIDLSGIFGEIVPDPTVTEARPGSWTGLGSSIPSECGFAPGSESYGPITVGSRVILGRHTPYTGPGQYGDMVYDDTDWAYDMETYVGMAATVLSLAGPDGAGCPGVYVDADGGSWFWRIRDMELAR